MKNNERNYYEVEEFANTYLEDSYVLDIVESSKKICFIMELVLTENHRLYSSPSPEHQYCYRSAEIVFENVTSSAWRKNDTPTMLSKDGTTDMGNIDQLTISNGGHLVVGDWGEVTIVSDTPYIQFASGTLNTE